MGSIRNTTFQVLNLKSTTQILMIVEVFPILGLFDKLA